MARVLVTTDYLVPGDEVDHLLRQHGHIVSYRPAIGSRDPAAAAALFDGMQAAIVASESITADMLSNTTDLRVIARSGVGFDSIDVAAATARGIWVCNTPGVNHDAVAEMTLALILMSARRMVTVVDSVRMGGWPRSAGTELRGATLAVIGYGPSGRAVTDLATAFGMSVLVHTQHPVAARPNVTFVDWHTALTRADYLSLHTKADDRTRRMINAAALAAMKPTATLVNTARGSLVDEHALADALDAGQIAAAALDVLDVEPLPAESRLRRHPNVLVTSHLAGQTFQARRRAGLTAAADVIAVLDGREPRHPVGQL